MTDQFRSMFFGGMPDGWLSADEPLSSDLLAELDDEMLATAMIDASSADRQALWAEVERRRLNA